jgi:uncharacterized protein (TIGR03083 family)
MDHAASAVMTSWDRLVDLGERIGSDDWSRSTPCPDTDVGGLLAHVAGANLSNEVGSSSAAYPARRGKPHRLLDGLWAARTAQATRIEALTDPERTLPRTGPATTADAATGATGATRRNRLLGAWCLDLWVHGYDLATGLGEPVDLDEDSPAVATASAYLLRLVPQLFARRTGASEGAGLRIALHGAIDHDRAVTVQDGRGRWSPDGDHAGHTVTGTPGALVLLLSGRSDPAHLRDVGALDWSGSRGEAFVQRARLLV